MTFYWISLSVHFFSGIFLWYYYSISLLLVTIKNFLRIFRVWLSARPFLWLHWSWQDTSFLFSSPCSDTPSRLQMSARWVRGVFQFDLPFDIRLQINRNWNLAENSVTEIDIYVQHSVRSACKYIEWRREGTLFPETCRRNVGLKSRSPSWVPHSGKLAFGSPHKTYILQTYSDCFCFSSSNSKDWVISVEVQLSSSGP